MLSLKSKLVGTMGLGNPGEQKLLAKPAARYSLSRMSAHNLTRDYQSPVTPRLDDEEDDDREDATPKPTAAPARGSDSSTSPAAAAATSSGAASPLTNSGRPAEP